MTLEVASPYDCIADHAATSYTGDGLACMPVSNAARMKFDKDCMLTTISALRVVEV